MPLTLARILAASAPLEWFEGVAVAQALGAALLRESDSSDVRVPDPGKIQLSPDGEVTPVDAGPAGQSAVYRIARLVEALVPADRMPVQLRLLLLTAASATPPYATLLEFTQALDYYERPNRREILQAVHARFADLPAAGADVPASEIPLAPIAEAPVRLPWWQRHRQAIVVAAVLVFFVGVGVLGWWAAIQPPGTWLGDGRQQVVQATRETARAVGEAAATGLQKVKQQLGLVEASPPEVPAPVAVASTGRSSSPRRPPLLSRPTVGEGSLAQVSPAPTAPVADPTPAIAEEPPPAPPIPEDRTIYDTDAPGLVPPVSVWPKLPSEPPPGVRLEDLPLLELVISKTGEVESVKLLSTRSGSVRTSMMLSAVKAWRFEPATKEGRPVRYRHRLRVTIP
jgi:protein TonB